MNFRDIAFLGQGVTPAAFPGLAGWWDADSLGYADGTAIDNGSNKWTDRSGNGNHLIQATAANQPVLKTGIINGRAVVRFDGVAAPNHDYLAFTSALNLTRAGSRLSWFAG